MSRVPSVVHLVAPAPFGGLESVVSRLAAGQHRRGARVHLFALLESGMPEPPLVGNLRSGGVDVTCVVTAARSFRAQKAALTAFCETFNPDVLHCHGYLPDALAAALGRRIRLRRVTTVHGYTGGSWRNQFYEWLQRRAHTRFDAVVAVSKKLGRQISADGLKGRVWTIPNAWSVQAVALTAEKARESIGASSGRFTIGWIGRISREKGLDVFIDSLSRLGDLPISAVIIGDGPERKKLEQKARDSNNSDRVIWVGQRRDAAEVFAAFDLVVLSSRTEGTPIVLFEAIHAGVPIIASAVGGIPDVVSPEEAVLVPSDDPIRLGDAIRAAYDSPSEGRERASRARARLTHEFAEEPWLDSYDRLYQTLLSAAPPI